MKEEEIKKVVNWFNRIIQLTKDRKTYEGVIMTPEETLHVIQSIAIDSNYYINNQILKHHDDNLPFFEELKNKDEYEYKFNVWKTLLNDIKFADALPEWIEYNWSHKEEIDRMKQTYKSIKKSNLFFKC